MVCLPYRRPASAFSLSCSHECRSAIRISGPVFIEELSDTHSADESSFKNNSGGNSDTGYHQYDSVLKHDGKPAAMLLQQAVCLCRRFRVIKASAPGTETELQYLWHLLLHQWKQFEVLTFLLGELQQDVLDLLLCILPRYWQDNCWQTWDLQLEQLVRCLLQHLARQKPLQQQQPVQPHAREPRQNSHRQSQLRCKDSKQQRHQSLQDWQESVGAMKDIAQLLIELQILLQQLQF